MTRKDYIRIAEALRQVRASYGAGWDSNLFRACDDHARKIADTLANDNPRFDRARFLAACDATADGEWALSKDQRQARAEAQREARILAAQAKA